MKAGMVLWNTTDGDYAIIESVNTTTNTIVVDTDVDTSPFAWAASDAITTRIQLSDGIFNINIVNISSLDFDSDSYYVQVQFDSTPGGGDALNETFTPRKRLGAVAYAMRSRYSDELGGIGSGQFLRSDTSDNYTSGTLAFDGGTTLDIDGDLSIADTAIAFDGASTELTITGDLTINTDDLIVEKSTGDVGIGDASPDHKLDVEGNIGLAASGYINWGDTDGETGYGFKDNAGTLQFKNSGGSWTNFGSGSSLWTQSGSDIYYNSGNVGIGTSGPFNERLDVNGRIYIADTTAPGTTTNRLYSVAGVLYWNGTALSGGGSIYGANGSIADGSYLNVNHAQNTYDVVVSGFYYDDIESKWKPVENFSSTIDHDLGNEFNPTFSQKSKVNSAKIDYNENDLGDGSDGDIIVSSDPTNINTTQLISGRTCADASVYNATALTSNTATVTPAISSDCIEAGDEVLIMNLQGTTSAYTNVGNYETLIVQSVSTPTITFTSNKTKYYGDGSTDDTNLGIGSSNQKVIVQRVPNYDDVTVNSSINFTATDFGTNGYSGGVMFFRATGTVAINGTVHTDELGFDGGGVYVAESGGDGGDSFCGVGGSGGTSGSNGAAGGGAAYLGGSGGNGSCGGGGGADSTAGTGSASAGGAGGGGSSRNSAGGGGGYGTFGYGGEGYGGTNGTGTNGGTNTSGAGGALANGGGGGGGGTYGDVGLDDLFMGSGGGGAGGYTDTTVGPGGDGGGIVYIAADTITVSGSVSADGEIGSSQGTRGAGGGGAGGSLKLIGNTITLGAGIVTSNGGVGGTGGVEDGGDGGDGRIAVYYASSISGTTSPTYDSNSLDYNTYAIYTGEEVHTPGATALNSISWTEDLDTNGEIQVQTRSGDSDDSTDDSWEGWKPVVATTNVLSLSNGDTHTEWSGTNATVTEGDVTRDLDYFEDEDETTAGDITKVSSSTAGGYAEDTISSTDISGYDYIALWVRSSTAGNTLKFGFGEAAATEFEETITVDQADTWQKVYWDISDITSTSTDCDGVTKLRLTKLGAASDVIYLDNVTADTYLSTPGGSTITSTGADYIQYRFILTTTDTAYSPTVSDISINLTNADGTYDIDADRVKVNIDPNYYSSDRLGIIEEEMDEYKEINTETSSTSVSIQGGYDPGTGVDGDRTIDSNTNINTVNTSGRSCGDGGDAVNYNVLSFSSDGTEATVDNSVDTGCIVEGDEVLLINLQGTVSAYTNVGNYETLRVEDVTGSVVTFTSSKTNYYGDNSNDDTNLGTGTSTQKVMLQRIPNYEDVTVDSGYSFYPSDWETNSRTGGVIFFRANGAVAINGTISASGRGYDGGNGYTAISGGDGGEAFCGAGGSGGTSGSNGAAGGGAAAVADGGGSGGNGSCGGGGGADSSAGTGSVSAGGSGGGGSGRNGGGGGGGYGTPGDGGYNHDATQGNSGGTNYSGDGYNHTNGGGGGGGGSYGDSELSQLFFGSGGGAGGGHTDGNGGNGGDGGGIIYIAGNSITVSGYINNDGSDGQTTTLRAAGGAGAGGSVKLVANSVNVGSGITTSDGGAGGTCAHSYGDNGGDGGDGRIAIYHVDTYSGSPSPVADTAEVPVSPYAIYVSDEVATNGVIDYNKIRWWMDDDSYGLVEAQTRSGDSNNSMDNTWEDWKPVVADTNVKDLSDSDTHTEWTGTNITVAEGDVARDVNYFEDEDASNEDSSSSISDSYSESNFGYNWSIYNGSSARGQSFESLGGLLDSVKIYASKSGSPTGNVYAKIYEHSGTYGTTSVGTGNPLATSDPVDASTISVSKELVTLNFSGNDRISLTDTYYVVTFSCDGGDVSNKIYLGTDNSSPTHGGNLVHYSGTWSYNAAMDLVFYVYEKESPITKMTSSTTDGYAEDTVTSADLSSLDYIAFWVRSSQSGNVIKFGIGESAATEQEKTFNIDTVDTWQKIYWDISDVNYNDRDAITKLRLTNLASGAITLYLDNVTADRYFDNSIGEEITSTPNEYIQYRLILTTTNSAYRPKVHNVRIEYNNGYKVVIEDLDNVRLYNHTGSTKSLRLNVSTVGDAAGGDSLPAGTQGYVMYYNSGAWAGTSAIFVSGTDIGIGDTTPDHKLDVGGNIGLSASGYINWGDTDGASGYGFRDNAGTLEYKNSSGSWKTLGGSDNWADPKWVLEAEYDGATLTADGTDNDGTLTSDNAGSSTSWMNYYQFSSSETDLNDYDIRVRFTLPEDFSSWDTNGVVIDYVTQSTSSANNKIDFYFYIESSASLDTSDVDNVSGTGGVWTTATIAGSSLTDCNAAGETCLLIMRAYSKDSNYVRVGDITFDYVRP